MPIVYSKITNYASAYTQFRSFFYHLSQEVIVVNVKQATVLRFQEIMKQRKIRPNELANMSGVTPSTVYSMLDERRKELSINTIKKLCDGLDMTLGEFFSTELFDNLEQEIK